MGKEIPFKKLPMNEKYRVKRVEFYEKPNRKLSNLLEEDLSVWKTFYFQLNTIIRKFKIIRITDSYPPPWNGLGPGPYGLSIAQHKLGNEVVVVAKHRRNCEEVDSRLPFQVVRIRAKKDRFDFAAYHHFKSLHKKKPFDILHTHGNSFFWIQLINRFIKIINIPIVVSVHNIRDYQNQIYRKTDMFSLTEKALNRDISNERIAALMNFRKWFYSDGIKQRICYRSGNMLLPVSHTLAEELIRTTGVDKSRVNILPNGVDMKLFSKTEPADLSEYGVDEKDRVLLYVGRLLYTKDITSLIMSLKYLKTTDIKLLIIGDGPWSGIYHEIVEKQDLQNNVLFISNIPHNRIASFYKRCNIFVFTSFSEGLPKVILEAMAAGKPIIGADVEGVRDLVDTKKNGLLFKPNSPESIAKCVSMLLANNNLIETMGQQSSNIIKEQYVWEKVAERCQTYYKQLLIKGSV